jgi:tight adherence protein B
MQVVLIASILFVLTALSMGSLLLAALHPQLAADSVLDQRVALISAARARVRRAGNLEERYRNRSLEDILREVDDRQKGKSRARASLLTRMRQADVNWTKTTYWLVCLVTATVCFGLTAIIVGLGTLPALGFAISSGLSLPHLYVNFKRKARFGRFLDEFPNAVDVIVRGVKTGLPVGECLKIIATEGQDPVQGEFRKIIEDQALGMPLAESVQRLAERIPLPEATFFSIVIAIQSSTGGGLAEALGNLAKVLRDRKKMLAKIQAMSSEAKASAGIIASLPVFVVGAVYLTSPSYIELLFTTLIGHVVLYGCGVWMSMGVLIMRKMVNFKI